MKFIKTDSEGYITTFGELDYCPPGAIVVPDETVITPSMYKKRYVDGKVVETAEPLFGTPSYTMMRAAQYPSVGDQLGAIWKAIAPLIENTEAEAILAKIQAVKDANPKT